MRNIYFLKNPTKNCVLEKLFPDPFKIEHIYGSTVSSFIQFAFLYAKLRVIETY